MHNLFLQLMGNIALLGAGSTPTNFAAGLTEILILTGILILSELSARPQPRKGPTAMEDPIQAIDLLNNSDLSLTDLHDLHRLADLLASGREQSGQGENQGKDCGPGEAQSPPRVFD